MPRSPEPINRRAVAILSKGEIEALYSRPHFTPEEQLAYFPLSASEKATMMQLHSIKSRLYFVLQLGYFKASHQFFIFDLPEVEADALYVQRQYFPDYSLSDLNITKVTRLKQRQLILDLCNYRVCQARQRQELAQRAKAAARTSSKPIYVFRELIGYLTEQRLVAPGYSTLQEIVAQALTAEQTRLTAIIKTKLPQTASKALSALLADGPGLYDITLLKREPKGFSLAEIKREVERGEQIGPLYHQAKALMPVLDISNESIKYYASLVSYYSVFRLKQLDRPMAYLYLLCFIYHRYQRLNDNLLRYLIHKVRAYGDEAKNAAKERIYDARVVYFKTLPKVGQILQLLIDEAIPQDTPFHQVQADAFTILDRQQLLTIADQIATKVKFDESAFQWEHIDTLVHQFKRNLRQVLLAVELAAARKDHPLIEALDFLKSVFWGKKPLAHHSLETFPTSFISHQNQRYLYGRKKRAKKHLLPDRYEFLAYRMLRQELEAGDIFCRDSVHFRSFEDDLISEQQWQARESLIAETGLTVLQQSGQAHLASLEELLEDRLSQVNQRIANGENEYLQIKKGGKQTRWTLQYPRNSDPVNHLFFDTLNQVDIGNVLHFVQQQCHFMDCFDHVISRYAKQPLKPHILTACLVAWGTNMGVGKMAEISDMAYYALAATSDNFIRLETLREANDRISNATAQLPIFRHYDLDDVIHSSSDGQKFETRIHTFNARYSPKYFGLKKGIVSYTLVANHIPINARIIGANEHESHFVFDILFNNTTQVQPQVHSTDAHGTNEVNFALLYFFGYQFAPRYLDIYAKVTKSLYGFKHPSLYEDQDFLIKPIRKINTQLILDEWDNFQRILLSLALKSTTQSVIVSKLSAFPRKNKTKRALWEFDNIIRSLYLLDYIDQPPLRRNIQQALNRGENYHQLRRAVSFANFGKLRFKTEYEQQIWNDCSRLLTNCIIYYNAFILSALLEAKATDPDVQVATLLKHISPVAWQHINLQGRYEFNKLPDPIDIPTIIRDLPFPIPPTPSS